MFRSFGHHERICDPKHHGTKKGDGIYPINNIHGLCDPHGSQHHRNTLFCGMIKTLNLAISLNLKENKGLGIPPCGPPSTAESVLKRLWNVMVIYQMIAERSVLLRNYSTCWLHTKFRVNGKKQLVVNQTTGSRLYTWIEESDKSTGCSLIIHAQGFGCSGGGLQIGLLVRRVIIIRVIAMRFL